MIGSYSTTVHYFEVVLLLASASQVSTQSSHLNREQQYDARTVLRNGDLVACCFFKLLVEPHSHHQTRRTNNHQEHQEQARQRRTEEARPLTWRQSLPCLLPLPSCCSSALLLVLVLPPLRPLPARSSLSQNFTVGSSRRRTSTVVLVEAASALATTTLVFSTTSTAAVVALRSLFEVVPPTTVRTVVRLRECVDWFPHLFFFHKINFQNVLYMLLFTQLLVKYKDYLSIIFGLALQKQLCLLCHAHFQ